MSPSKPPPPLPPPASPPLPMLLPTIRGAIESAPRCLAGTELTAMLASWGFRYEPDCPCRHRAVEMDQRGCDWCAENVGTIVGWLEEESARRSLLFSKSGAEMLVRYAIFRARRRFERLAKT